MRGANSGGRVLDHEAFRRIDSQQLRTLQIRLWMRLSLGNVLGCHQRLRKWYASEPQPRARQMTSSGGDHAPATFRNCAHQFHSTRHHRNAVAIIRLAAFQFLDFSFRIEMRSYGANHFDCAHAVAHRHHFVSVNSLLAGPDAPLPLDRAGGIDENSIEIEKNRGALEGGLSFFSTERSFL